VRRVVGIDVKKWNGGARKRHRQRCSGRGAEKSGHTAPGGGERRERMVAALKRFEKIQMVASGCRTLAHSFGATMARVPRCAPSDAEVAD
jgi:hypothetical protein